jgi:hypothetical protein
MTSKHPHNNILFSFKSIYILLIDKNKILYCFYAKFSTDDLFLLKKAVLRNQKLHQILVKLLLINYLGKLNKNKKLWSSRKNVHFRTIKYHFRTIFDFDSQNFITFECKIINL